MACHSLHQVYIFRSCTKWSLLSLVYMLLKILDMLHLLLQSIMCRWTRSRADLLCILTAHETEPHSVCLIRGYDAYPLLLLWSSNPTYSFVSSDVLHVLRNSKAQCRAFVTAFVCQIFAQIPNGRRDCSTAGSPVLIKATMSCS